jgi:hypothetical protein
VSAPKVPVRRHAGRRGERGRGAVLGDEGKAAGCLMAGGRVMPTRRLLPARPVEELDACFVVAVAATL